MLDEFVCFALFQFTERALAHELLSPKGGPTSAYHISFVDVDYFGLFQFTERALAHELLSPMGGPTSAYHISFVDVDYFGLFQFTERALAHELLSPMGGPTSAYHIMFALVYFSSPSAPWPMSSCPPWEAPPLRTTSAMPA